MKHFYFAQHAPSKLEGGAIIVASAIKDAEERYKKQYGHYPWEIHYLGGCGIEDFPEFTMCLRERKNDPDGRFE